MGARRLFFSIAFSPDGKQIVTTSYDRDIKVWDAESGSSRTISAHQRWVLGGSFSPLHSRPMANKLSPHPMTVTSRFGMQKAARRGQSLRIKVGSSASLLLL